MNGLEKFHPAVSRWFLSHFTAPTGPQGQAWPSIKNREHTLIAAPTGSGKTLAAFLAAIDDLVRKGLDGQLNDETYVVYVSPLKALSNDIRINLQQPLDGIRHELEASGLSPIEIRTLVRTGDTPVKERAAMTRRPPHIIVTTPESLYILLTSEGGRRMLGTARTLILDEIHAVVSDKRGSHLALSVERLQELVHEPLVRIGLSATQKPIAEVARFLVGSAHLNGNLPQCTIVDSGHARRLDVAIEMPGSPLEAVMSQEVWDEVFDKLAALIQEHRTTIVFVNSRRMAERVARHLGERLGDSNVTSHHGSLAREQRLVAEQRLKSGELRALVATASLELGIDIGAVDLVCQLGVTRSISALLQRIGRSGHTVGGLPKGRLFPLTRDELVESAALLHSIKRGELDHLIIPQKPLDILAQQIVAAVAASEWSEDELFATMCRAYPFRNLERAEFNEVVRMLSDGFTTRRGRRGTYLHRDAVNGRLRGRRGARLTAITSGGAIPDTSDYQVVLEPAGTVIGSVNEDFAIESLAGDIFQLGNTSWRIRRVEPGTLRVEDAQGQPPSIPFWLGEAPARTEELSLSLSSIRSGVEERLGPDSSSEAGLREAIQWLASEVGTGTSAAEQIVDYLAAAKAALGVLPTVNTIVMERFFDESGGTQIVIHSPFGSRLNRAWGLSLRKRFCRKFNFELQAAATENSIVFSLGPVHSFPLELVFTFLRSESVRYLLTQALLDAPMFGIRWRWNATRALAVPRWRRGSKVPPQLQRMFAEDLLALVFPDQLACAENLSGDIQVPDHPLVRQTITDCLSEAMDIAGLEKLLASLERGEKRLVSRELNEPSPLAQEVLTARPYAFLDDAPLEERRTQAVISRRWLSPESAAELGKLDEAAIERVRSEAWPQVESADELHDALLQLCFLTGEEGRSGEKVSFPSSEQGTATVATVLEFPGSPGWQEFFAELVRDKRAGVLRLNGTDDGLWVAAERLPQITAIFPQATIDPKLVAPEEFQRASWSPEDALLELLRGRLESLGPITASALAEPLGIPLSEVDAVLGRLEGEGFVMQGRFSPGAAETEWCTRRLLARIHSYTLNRLRREIEPVSSADFMRFLVSWQRVAPDTQGSGPESLVAALDQLEGFEAAAAAWEGEILPSRVADYNPGWLDALCLSGRVAWARMSPPKITVNPDAPEKTFAAGPVRNTPVTLVNRKHLGYWNALFPRVNEEAESQLSTNAQTVSAILKTEGASFFLDLVERSRLLPTMVEEALGELVSRGLVSADSFTGLRALLTPARKNSDGQGARRKRHEAFNMNDAGRWVLLKRQSPGEAVDAEAAEFVCRALLRRYGVIFRKLLERESIALPWRDMLRVYRRLEARGEIRGGRFVAGFSGEQFAMPEAVQLLRSIRRAPVNSSLISVSAADPLNLAGVIMPGPRLLPATANRLLYEDGIPVAVLEAKEIRFLKEMAPADLWQRRNALLRRNSPPQLRSYLRQSATPVRSEKRLESGAG